MAGFVIVMLAGFAGSFHCIGMCGGFACALGSARVGAPATLVMRHLLYNSGRLASYSFIGALAGLLGAALVGHGFGHRVGLAEQFALRGVPSHDMSMVLAGEIGLGQRLLSIAGGGFMIVMALQLFGVLRHRPASWAGSGSWLFAPALGALVRSASPASPLALGVLNGFLPCPLVFACAALAAAGGSLEGGILTMAAFGLGTFPAMLFMGSLGAFLGPALRRRGVRFAGSFVLLLGVITLLRGLAPALLHASGP